MLFRLMILRVVPVAMLKFWKKRNQLKKMLVMLCIGCVILFFAAVWELFVQKGWRGLIFLLMSLFPHFIFYGFGIWMMARCIYREWSERVWKRIYFLAILCVALGVLAENYINPKILQIVFEIFK